MAQTDFQALRYQFMGHWQAIEQAEPAERRVLLVELAKALAEWEAGQDEPLGKVQELKRTGHWSALAQVAAAQTQGIAERLGEEKQALRNRLLDSRTLIESSENQAQAVKQEIESISAELALGEARLAELTQQDAEQRQQLDAIRRLRDLQPEVERAKMEFTALVERLRQGEEPGDVLAGLVSLREVLATHYAAYLAASRRLSDQLLTAGSDALHALPTPEALAVPERLLVLDQELKAIDQLLAGQLQQQDVLDRETMARA
jgi:chromosome segregation ATPase